MLIDWWTLAIQTVNFLVVVWLLNRFLYKPVRRIIEEREAADVRAVSEAKKKADDAEAAKADYEQKAAELAKSQRGLEAELHATMRKERDTMLEDARQEADGILAEARERTERERMEALEGLKEGIADLAGEMARKALSGHASNGEAQLQQVLSHLDGLSDQSLSDLRSDLEDTAGALEIVSASELGEAERQRWQSALERRLGNGARIVFSVDPSLIEGSELHFPHAVLSFSVADRLRQLSREMKPAHDA
ncbi:hypothetical protein GR183_20440 [Stappia sp. GBMRC 2046]|uniref:ATP synthase subunit b n=1 Tax=Stappia sediminis TaxID=2692190 RepID=A0A7X3LY70_9HYPH|nr:F0F1 ATP synthase subunit delta [Stappia sediminis]MXN67284.1 hypothetical protein [Stappia sediminis]